MIKVFAAHQTAPIWRTYPPNDVSYYYRMIDESELVDGVYINKSNGTITRTKESDSN